MGGKGQKHDCFDCRLISLQLNIVTTKELQSNFSSVVIENICVDYFFLKISCQSSRNLFVGDPEK